MQVGILGPLEVTAGGDPVVIRGARERALLALLAVSVGQVVPADGLVEELWGGELPGDPANALQAAVSRLRKALAPVGAPVVLTRPPGYLLAVDADAIDARRFQRLVAEGRRRLREQPEEAARQLSDALALWRGPPVPELADTDTGRAEAARLSELRLAAEENRVEALLGAGRHAEVVGELEALVRAQPLRERRRAQLMLALYRSGRQAEALRAYQQARRVLGEELGLEPSPDLRRLEAAIVAHDPALSPPPGHQHPGGPPHNLPARANSFVGRWRERGELGKLLDEHRLVTLVGPGGVGKTSLALEVAAERVDEHPGGVWLVELGAVTDASVVVWSVATALGISEPAGMGAKRSSILDLVVERVAGTDPLLVLDNCEHLVEECAALVARMLAAAPRVHILATSREPLRVAGEAQYPVAPLALPEDATSVEELAGVDAVRLFVERADAVQPGFSLDAGTAAAVAQICLRLDGLPLAIELAAARTRSLPVGDIAARLDDRFRLLTSGHRDAAPRHQTLRATLDWSHELLSDPEAVLFRRLSVFAGDFGLAAAEAVGTGSGVGTEDVLDLLAGLVERSLVVAECGAARYRLLETVREYGRERLAEAGETDEVFCRHAAYFVCVAEEAEQIRSTKGARPVLERLEQELGELRAAIDWSLANRYTETALRLGGALGWYWFARRRGEGAEHLVTILAAAPDEPTWARARALQAAGVVGAWRHLNEASGWATEALAIFEQLGDTRNAASSKTLLAGALAAAGRVEEAGHLLAEAEASFRELGDQWYEGMTWRIRSWVFLMSGQLDQADKFGRRSLERSRQLDDPWGAASALGQLAMVAMRRGDYATAAELHEEEVALAREMGLWDNVHLATSELGTLAALAGDHERAAALFAEALEAGRTTGSKLHLAHTYNRMGLAARLRGDARAAVALHDQALALYRRLGALGGAPSSLSGLGFAQELAGDLESAEAHHRELLALATSGPSDSMSIPLALEGLASLAATRGLAERAATLLGAAAAARAAFSAPLPPAERRDVDRAADRARSQLGPDAFSDAYERGRSLTLAAAIDVATEDERVAVVRRAATDSPSTNVHPPCDPGVTEKR